MNRTLRGKQALASFCACRHRLFVRSKKKSTNDAATRIYRQLAGARGLDDDERWQHALFFAMSPQERCHFSLKTARSALSLRRGEKDVVVLPILKRTLRLANLLKQRRLKSAKKNPKRKFIK